MLCHPRSRVFLKCRYRCLWHSSALDECAGLLRLRWIEEDDGLSYAKHRSRRIARHLAEAALNIIRIQSGKVATNKRAQNEITTAAFGPSINAEFPRIGYDDCFAVGFEINVTTRLARFPERSEHAQIRQLAAFARIAPSLESDQCRVLSRCGEEVFFANFENWPTQFPIPAHFRSRIDQAQSGSKCRPPRLRFCPEAHSSRPRRRQQKAFACFHVDPHGVCRCDEDARIHFPDLRLPAFGEHLHPNQSKLPGFIGTPLFGVCVVLCVGKANRKALSIGRPNENGIF